MYLTLDRYDKLLDIYEQIVAKYGPPKHGKYLPTVIPIYDPKYELFAEFDHHTDPDCAQIIINFAKCKRMSDAVKSLLHEYMHALQDRRFGWYDRYEEEYGYEDNPYEVEAREFEENWRLFL